MSLAETVRDRIVRAIDEEQLGAYGLHVLVGHESAQHRWRSDDRVNLYSVSMVSGGSPSGPTLAKT